MQFADVITSLRRHWRASLALILLSGATLGAFLLTRNEVRGDDRWLASIQILVPARDEKGVRPEGVPAALLQGQAAAATSYETTHAALTAVGLDDSAFDKIVFDFGANETGDILILSVTAPEIDIATRTADSWAGAYLASRRTLVADLASGSRQSSRQALEAYQARLVEVERALRAADPALLELVDATNVGADGEPAAIDVPDGTPIDTILLVYERRTLLTRITNSQESYAEDSAEALVPQSFGTIVERPLPDQITPELPSPLVPIGVATGAGLLLALAVPVLLDRLDRSIRDAKTAATVLGAPVLSRIPATSTAQASTIALPGTPLESAYRALAATSIATDQLPRAILVTSAVGTAQDGAAANFAAALAGLGLKVALVATEARQAWFVDSTEIQGAPGLPEVLALANTDGLKGLIREALTPTNVKNLSVVAPGATKDDVLLEGLPSVLAALVDLGIDVTVIAGSSLLDEPSATILAWSTRSVLWVVESGAVTEQEGLEAASRLSLAGGSAFGVVLLAAKG